MEETVEVKLLSYRFIFKKMRWREHAAIQFEKGRDPQRVILAHALLEVAGIRPKDVEEAKRVMDAIPAAIIERVFKIWRAAFPPARKFVTSNLYCAPEPLQYSKEIERREADEDVAHTRTMQEVESKFGSQELAETRELERQILAAAQRRDGGFRGAVLATKDTDDGQ